MKYMLHTDICAYMFKGGNANLKERISVCEKYGLVMSMITRCELEALVLKAVYPDSARTTAQEIFQAVRAVRFDANAARSFGAIQAVLAANTFEWVPALPLDITAARAFGAVPSLAESRRHPYDLLIAAHAVSLDLILVTKNDRNFNGIPDLQVENWAR